MKIKALYRCSFFFSVKGIEYHLLYFYKDPKDKQFTEFIYQVSDNKLLSQAICDWGNPSAGTAWESLQAYLKK